MNTPSRLVTVREIDSTAIVRRLSERATLRRRDQPAPIAPPIPPAVAPPIPAPVKVLKVPEKFRQKTLLMCGILPNFTSDNLAECLNICDYPISKNACNQFLRQMELDGDLTSHRDLEANGQPKLYRLAR